MINKLLLSVICFSCLSFTSCSRASVLAPDALLAKQPNIIIVMTDDQGYGDFSFTGNPAVKTPNIDRLAKLGIQLTDFHVAPMCTPTRGQLLTGKDALHNGATIVCSGYSSVYPEVPLMPEILKDAGYKTGIFGKWHLGDNYPHRPMDRGFDHSVWHKGWGVSSVPDHWNNDYFDDYYWQNDSLKHFDGYCTDIWFNEAMKWMDDCNREGKPFFAYVATNAPHGPLYVDDRYRTPYIHLGRRLASYFGMIANIDENMGRLDSMLEASGIKNNTILIFMTDNGSAASVGFYNAHMRDRKGSLYEGGHRVPCLIQWPNGPIKAPSEINEMIQVQDILPTILNLCNVKTKLEFDGISIADLLKGKEQKELKSRIAVVQYGRQPARHLELPVKYDACVMWNKWRLINNTELYNIESDPGQKTDMASKHPEIVEKLSAHYEEWWKGAEPLVYNKFNYIHLGSSEEPETVLTAHDWMTMNTANHVYVRAGRNRTGAWNIHVEEVGNYTIRLYRWPKEAKLKLQEASPAFQGFDSKYDEGVALPISRANLRIGIQEYSTSVGDDDYCATFNVFLSQGNSTLQTFFYDDNSDQLCGAYYVYVSRNDKE